MLYCCGFRGLSQHVFDLDEWLALSACLLLGPFYGFYFDDDCIGGDALSWLSRTGTDLMPPPGN